MSWWKSDKVEKETPKKVHVPTPEEIQAEKWTNTFMDNIAVTSPKRVYVDNTGCAEIIAWDKTGKSGGKAFRLQKDTISVFSWNADDCYTQPDGTVCIKNIIYKDVVKINNAQAAKIIDCAKTRNMELFAVQKAPSTYEIKYPELNPRQSEGEMDVFAPVYNEGYNKAIEDIKKLNS